MAITSRVYNNHTHMYVQHANTMSKKNGPSIAFSAAQPMNLYTWRKEPELRRKRRSKGVTTIREQAPKHFTPSTRARPPSLPQHDSTRDCLGRCFLRVTVSSQLFHLVPNTLSSTIDRGRIKRLSRFDPIIRNS